MKELLTKLNEAYEILSKLSGGHSGEFLSAEEFSAAFQHKIKEIENGNKKAIQEVYYWFAPTCEWDDFVTENNNELGNTIFELLEKHK